MLLLLYIIRCLPIAGGAPKSHDVPKNNKTHTHTHTHKNCRSIGWNARRLRYRLEQTRVGGRLKKNETTEGGNVSKVERNTRWGCALLPIGPPTARGPAGSLLLLVRFCVCAGAAFTFALFGHDFLFPFFLFHPLRVFYSFLLLPTFLPFL